jgi:hypothetical protein
MDFNNNQKNSFTQAEEKSALRIISEWYKKNDRQVKGIFLVVVGMVALIYTRHYLKHIILFAAGLHALYYGIRILQVPYLAPVIDKTLSFIYRTR